MHEDSNLPPQDSFLSLSFSLFLSVLFINMSSIGSSQGMVLATAMAVSGTVILFALRRSTKSLKTTEFGNIASSRPNLRPCISSDTKKRQRSKSKKRVHFADNLIEDSDDLETKESLEIDSSIALNIEEQHYPVRDHRMPANRAALYNGILQDRLQRMACSY
ncbi:hypothetical protein QJS04_geneDACA005664 [Acorus gramineus]|uniref:Transmembrane protein n=1 Tax=Acorus gramineus TaxID=55184 RepID=A0AAV8ZXG1_ACOGR|nr:hypothetical protein QJS04_geneDACA005664 [Acorus gramineus]